MRDPKLAHILVRLLLTGNYRLPFFHGVHMSREPYIVESCPWNNCNQNHLT